MECILSVVVSTHQQTVGALSNWRYTPVRHYSSLPPSSRFFFLNVLHNMHGTCLIKSLPPPLSPFLSLSLLHSLPPSLSLSPSLSLPLSQVREMAASTVSGLVRCGYISCIDRLKVSNHFGRGELFAEMNLCSIPGGHAYAYSVNMWSLISLGTRLVINMGPLGVFNFPPTYSLVLVAK